VARHAEMHGDACDYLHAVLEGGLGDDLDALASWSVADNSTTALPPAPGVALNHDAHCACAAPAGLTPARFRALFLGHVRAEAEALLAETEPLAAQAGAGGHGCGSAGPSSPQPQQRPAPAARAGASAAGARGAPAAPPPRPAGAHSAPGALDDANFPALSTCSARSGKVRVLDVT